MPDPIYKTKDGQRVTKSQLLNSGYSEDRITKGLGGGILTLVGDTQTPSQLFKTQDGQSVTTEDLLNSGYSQERIDKGVQNGILSPDESIKKKGKESPVVSAEAGAGFGGGITETSPSKYPLKSTSEKPQTGSVADLLTTIKDDKPANVDIPGIGILNSKKYVTSINHNGNVIPISIDNLPDGYQRTEEGAKSYAADLSYRLNNKDDNTSVTDAKKMINLARHDANQFTFKPEDISEISKYTNYNGDELTQQNIHDLEVRRKELGNQLSSLLSKNVQGEGVKDIQDEIGKISNYIKRGYGDIANQVGAAAIPGSPTQVGVLGAEQSSTLQSLIKNPESDLKGRFNVEQLGPEFLVGLAAQKATTPIKYDNIVSRIANGKIVASTEVANAVSQGAEILDAQNLELLKKGKIDNDEYERRRADISKTIDDNIYKRPDILQSQTAQAIADYYAPKHSTYAGEILGKYFYSDKEIDAVPKEVFTKAGIDPDRPEVKEVIKSIKKNEGILPFDNAIAKDGLIREVAKGLGQPFRGVTATIAGVGKSSDEKAVESALQPVNDYTQQRTAYYNKHYGAMADMFNGLGQFAGQYLLMEAGAGAVSGIGEVAGGSKAFAEVFTPETAISRAALEQGKAQSVLLRQGGKFGNKIIDKADLYSIIGMSYLQSYDSYYKEAQGISNNPLAQTIFANVMATMEGLSETMFDNIKFGRQTIANFKNGFNVNRVAQIFDKGVFDKASQAELKNIVADKLKIAMKATATAFKQDVKESFEEVPVAFADFVATAMVNPDAVKQRQAIPEMKDAFTSAMINFSLPFILGGAGSMKHQFSTKETNNAALMIAAQNRNTVSEALNNQLADGAITEDEHNAKMQALNTAAYHIQRTPVRRIDGTPLTEDDRADYLRLTMQAKYIETNTGPDADEVVKKISEDKIKEINDQKLNILKPSGLPSQNAPGEKNKGTVLPKIESAVIEINGKQYEGKNHAEAILSAQQDGQDISQVDRSAEGKFKLSDGTIIDRAEAKTRFGQDRSELLIPQDDAAKQANKDYQDNQLFNQVQESGNDGVKALYDTPEKMGELQSQALTAPASVNDNLGGNRELTTDLIAKSGKEKIQEQIDLLTEEKNNVKTDDLRTEDIDRHLALLNEGLKKAKPTDKATATTPKGNTDNVGGEHKIGDEVTVTAKDGTILGKKAKVTAISPDGKFIQTDLGNAYVPSEQVSKPSTPTVQKGGYKEISWRPGDKQKQIQVVENLSDELIKRLGGKITHKSPSGSVYIELNNGETVRVSDHKVDTYDPLSSKNTGTTIGMRGRKVDYDFDIYNEDKIDKLEDHIRDETDYPEDLLPKKQPTVQEGKGDNVGGYVETKAAVILPQDNRSVNAIPLKKGIKQEAVNPVENKLEYISQSAEDFDEFERMVNADPELVDYINQQLASSATLQDISKIGTLEGEKITERGAIGVNKQQLMMLLGSTMYNKPLAQVAVKELLQNSFDAVKARQNLTDNKGPGNLTIGINQRERTISIRDDGIGMTPDIVKNAFLSIGGTNKEGLSAGERSGGLGLAKVQFLMGSQSVKVITVRDGIKTTIEASNVQLYNDDFDINTEPTNEPNGSFVEVKIPQNYVTMEGQTRNIDFPGKYNWSEFDILEKPLIGNVNVNIESTDSYGNIKNDVVPIGNNSTKDTLPPLFTKAKFDWGEADIYMSEDKTDYPKHQILSSGIYQFDNRFYLREYEKIPYNIVVNIKPSVGSTSEQYPFNNQREGFKNTVSEDIDALASFIRKHAAGEAEKEAVDVFSDIKPLPKVDPNKILSPEERTKLYADIEKTIEENRQRRIMNNQAPVEQAARDIYIRSGEVRNSQNDQLITSTDQEKQFKSSFSADRNIEDVAPVNTEFFNPAFPQYHNNTNIDYLKTPGAVEFITDFGNTVLQLVRFAGDNFGYEYAKLATNAPDKFFAGVSIDKTYGGVHIRKIINAIFVNPLSFNPENLEEAVGIALHITLHEINHTTASGEGANFTTDLATLYGKIYSTGKYGLFEGLFRSVYKKHYETFQNLKYDYDKSTTKNLSKSFEGNQIKGPDKGNIQGNEGDVSAGQSAGTGSQGDRQNPEADKSGDVISSKLADAGKEINVDKADALQSKLKEIWDKKRGDQKPPVPPGETGSSATGGKGSNFNFFKNRILPASGEMARTLSGDTIESGTGKDNEVEINYDKKHLNDLEDTGQDWIRKAKEQFNSTPTEYAERLFNDVKAKSSSPSVRGLGMVSLLNSIDNDLDYNDELTYGQWEKMSSIRRQLVQEIAKNAREGSLTLNAQRLIYKLYNGEYKTSDSIAPIVTPSVQEQTDNIVEKLKREDTEISEVVKEQRRKGKKEPEPEPVKKKAEKKAQPPTFFDKLTKGMSPESVEKLKNKIIEIANKINCGKKK